MMGFFSATFPVRRWLASIQIDGEWLLCDDSIVRPVIRGEIPAGDGRWVPSAFLVDTGADRTVFSAPILTALHLQPIATQEHLGGLGGLVAPVIIETQVRFRREAGGRVLFRSQ
jgi:predicted aspartyl protease